MTTPLKKQIPNPTQDMPQRISAKTYPCYRWLGTLLLFIGLTATHVWAGDNRHVLVLHSYHKGLTWTDSITKGIENQFNASKLHVEIEYAFMDTKRIFNQAYIDQLVSLYSVKFKDRSFDAIISTDDHAFKFLLRHRHTLFGHTPIVFCGVNNFRDSMLAQKPHITGVLESFDMLATINSALDLQPQAKRLIAIGDQSVSGKANKERFEAIIPQLKRPVDITILDNHTMAEVLAYVGSLSHQDILVWLVFTVDRNQRFFSFEESTRMISSHSRAPMYSFWDFNLGHGIVGGKLTSGNLQGERATELAIRILNGESTDNLPVIKKSPNQYMFDHQVLSKFGLDPARLPANSLIINRPNSYYFQNKQLVWSVAVIFCSMSIIIVALLMSIAAKRKTQRALFSSKDRYQNVFNSASVALFEADFFLVSQKIDALKRRANTSFRDYLDSHPQEVQHLASQIRIIDANPAALILFRAEDKNTLIDALLKEILPEQSSVLKEILISLADNHDYLVWEDEVKNLDETPLHVILSLNFPSNKHNLRRMVVSVFDITDRKMSEQALRRSEDRFRTVFNQAASGMALIDIDGSYLRINSALCQMLGLREKELLKKTWREITHEDDIDLSLAHMEEVLGGKTPHPIEKRYIHKNGQAVHVLFNLAAIFDKQRQPLYLIAQVQDISQIKAAQATLKEKEERYRKFFEGDLSGVYVATPEGKLIMCNDVFAKILGLENHEEAIGSNIIKYYKNPGQRPMLVEQLSQAKRIEHFELELLRKDGSTVQCLINAIGRFDAHGSLVEIQGYLMDVTRLKSLEVQLLHAQKMESIGTMAGGVAHDFNNLLMGVMGNASLLLLEKEEGHPDYQRLKSIEDLVQSGSDLTRQLLGFAKGGKYEVRTTDLNKLILRSVQMFARTHKEIEVHTDLSKELKLVEADRSQLDQVLYNLYLNAWQAMEYGGRLDIQTRNQPLDDLTAAPYGLAPGNYVVVSVQDSGIGMDEKIQQRIFDPFFTTKERERGTGLGLASAYGIIKNHLGSITVKSQPNEGSCFTIFLPATYKKEVDTAPETSSRLIGGTETILVVDDEQGVLDAVGSMLQHLGYTVHTAADGNEAIDAFANDHRNIDLVILDMVMPGMGGKEAFKIFKQIDPDVKVLLCSGYTANGQAASILKEGCSGFIQKPFTIRQLSQKLNQVFRHPRKSGTEDRDLMIN